MSEKASLSNEAKVAIAQRIRGVLSDFVSRLDIPKYRTVLLVNLPDEAYNVTCDKSFQRVYHAINSAFGIPVNVVKSDDAINDSMYLLVLNVSTRDDRLVACRQIDKYPCHIEDDNLSFDGNARYLAKVVFSAVDSMVLHIKELADDYSSSKQEVYK